MPNAELSSITLFSGPSSPGCFGGNMGQLQRPNPLYGLKRKPKMFRMIFHLLMLFLLHHYKDQQTQGPFYLTPQFLEYRRFSVSFRNLI